MKNEIVLEEMKLELGKYTKLVGKYTIQYLYRNLNILKKYDVDTWYEMVILSEKFSLKSAMTMLESVSNKSISHLYKLVSEYAYIEQIPECVRKYTTWASDELINKLLQISQLVRLANDYKFERFCLSYITGEYCNAVFALEQSYLHIDNICEMSEHFDDYLKQKGFVGGQQIYKLIDSNIKLASKTAVQTLTNMYKDETEFIDFVSTLSDAEMKSITTVRKIQMLHDVFVIGKEYCELYLRLIGMRFGTIPLFLPLLKIHVSDKSNEEKKEMVKEVFKHYESDEDISWSMSIDTNEVFKFFLQNNAKGCMDWLYKTYAANWKHHLGNRTSGVIALLNTANYPFLTEEEYILKDFIEFRQEVGILVNARQDELKDERRELRNQQRSEKAIDCIEIMQEFIESDYGKIVEFYSDKYPKRNVESDKALCKEYAPDVYEKYREKVDKITKCNYAILNNRAEKLCKAITDSKYELPLLDFCKLYTPPNLNDYFTNIAPKLQSNYARILRTYYGKIRTGIRYFNVEDVMKEKLIIGGREITDDDKNAILEYIKNNRLPKLTRIYKEICRLYVKGEIDLNEVFLEEASEA